MRKGKSIIYSVFFATLSCALAPASALAEVTEIHVRVLSKGAKFIGSSMGGVLVTIEDADTGELLASGKTKGSTGDTNRIMKEALPHHAPVSTKGAAVFETEVDIDEPTKIRITALGPLAQRQAANEISLTQWVIPGKDIVGGDAFRLEMPGFVVDVLAPPAHQKLSGGKAELNIAANVTLMCGCPISPGGLWNADDYEVAAIIKRNGKKFKTLPLAYAGSTSQFSSKMTFDSPGAYEVAVYAFDKANGNTGVDFTTFILK